ncbi:hypothetical protein [uncultured Adlercreutzia sp.]|uniref:hypothetical protein n=1 Tax=uncultured Adlercreutzia sp. TaxID=875803 RepID=UPI002675E956|nr:hypothetical protein [uncultured Adlercreutzia sp.]
MAERTGEATANFIAWVGEKAQQDEPEKTFCASALPHGGALSLFMVEYKEELLEDGVYFPSWLE